MREARPRTPRPGAGRPPRARRGPACALRGWSRAVDDQRLGDEVVDRLLRVERLVRVLEDDLDPPPVARQAPSTPQSVVTSSPSKKIAAGGLAGELDDDPPGRGLAAARLAHEARGPRRAGSQVDAVDRPDDAARAPRGRVERTRRGSGSGPRGPSRRRSSSVTGALGRDRGLGRGRRRRDRRRARPPGRRWRGRDRGAVAAGG